MNFNVGDRVICTTRVADYYDTENISGTVVTLDESACGVVFDVNVNRYSLDGLCSCGRGLWVHPEDLSPLYHTKKASEREFISI